VKYRSPVWQSLKFPELPSLQYSPQFALYRTSVMKCDGVQNRYLTGAVIMNCARLLQRLGLLREFVFSARFYPRLIFLGTIFLTQPSGLHHEMLAAQENRAVRVRPDIRRTVTGQIMGTVIDKSGAIVSGSEVTLKLPDGTTRTTFTDQQGRYRFSGVQVGQNYTLRFSYRGFRAKEISNVVVSVGKASTVNMQFDMLETPTPSPVPPPSPLPTSSPIFKRPSPAATPTVNPSPQVSPTPPDLEAMIQTEVQKLRESEIAFNPPREMQEQKTEVIEARISFQEIGSALTQGLEGRGTPQVESLKVSPIMKVALIGAQDAFYIVGSGDEQIVEGKTFAEWKWWVTPLKSGDQNLTLTATTIIFLPGRGEKPYDYKTLEKPILVHVDRWRASKQFLANNWQWLWTVILVPGVGLLWGLRRRKRRKARSHSKHNKS